MRSNEPREAIVDKLHGALAALRRERDDMHRRKELAAERLRLTKADREALEQTVKSLEGRLASLSNSANAKNEIDALQQEVTRFEKEVSCSAISSNLQSHKLPPSAHVMVVRIRRRTFSIGSWFPRNRRWPM